MLCVTLAGIVIGWISHFGDPVERAFMAHKTNQQIVERNPRWNQTLNGLDVSDLFERNLKRGDYERNLEAMGYECSLDQTANGSAASSCRSKAGGDFVCQKTMHLRADIDAQNLVRKVAADYWLTCL
jgi:hypothetical protein